MLEAGEEYIPASDNLTRLEYVDLIAILIHDQPMASWDAAHGAISLHGWEKTQVVACPTQYFSEYQLMFTVKYPCLPATYVCPLRTRLKQTLATVRL